jgi:hypothetical protein
VTAAFDAVKDAASAAFGWVKDHWPLILAILTGPVGVAVLLIVTHWKQIKSKFGDALDGIKGLWGDFMGFLRGLPGKIGNAARRHVGRDQVRLPRGAERRHRHLELDAVVLDPGVQRSPGTTSAAARSGCRTFGHVATGGVMTSSGALVVGEHGREILTFPPALRSDRCPRWTPTVERRSGDLGTLTVVVKSDTGEVIEQKLVQVKRVRGVTKLAFIS